MTNVRPGKPDRGVIRSEVMLGVFAIASSMFFIFFPLLDPLLQAKGAAAEPNIEDVRVMVQAMEFGGFTPNELEVVANKTLRIRFWTMDVEHSFNLPQIGLDFNLPVSQYEVVEIETEFHEDGNTYSYIINGTTFEFDGEETDGIQPLVLEFKCNKYCSPGHWSMRGTITVLPPG